MESEIVQHAWLIPMFPLLAFLLLISLGRHQRNVGALISITAAAASFIVTILLSFDRLSSDAADYVWNDFVWLTFGTVEFRMGYEITNLNVLMLLVVTIVSLLVNIYSKGYMRNDDRLNVFYAYVSLFTFAMLALVISSNLLQMYIFWELVGVCSFLLIGFWYHRPEARAAAKKAFIVTRIGDVGLLFAVILLFWYVPNHALDFTSIHNAIQMGELSTSFVTLLAILIFIGAIGKSGQFPLHTWLPDAMVGPTPISALIHAATMVAAGVFLVAKTYSIFEASPIALDVVSYTGVFTAVFAASIAIAQKDMKRVLAFSTISQLGFMMLALGLGTALGYAAGLFHLFTHAIFKALLFLAAGSVITAIGRQNINEMGGVGKSMKITMWTFAIGALSLAGIVPFSGFWSKDAILSEAFAQQPVLFWIALIAAFLTALYIAKLFFLVFTGEKRHDTSYSESSVVMTIPLIILAVFAVISGFVMLPNAPWLAEWLTGEEISGHTNWLVILLSTLAGAAGIVIGWRKYGIKPPVREEKASFLYRMLENRYYIDEMYDTIIIRPIQWLGKFLSVIDRVVISGAVKLVSGAVTATGKAGTRLQNGQIQTYGLIVLISITVLIVAMVGRRFF